MTQMKDFRSKFFFSLKLVENHGKSFLTISAYKVQPFRMRQRTDKQTEKLLQKIDRYNNFFYSEAEHKYTIKLHNQLHTTVNRYGGIREQTKRQTDSTSSYFRGSIFCRSCTYINPVIVVISCVKNQNYEIDLTLMNPRFSPHLLSLFCHYSIPFLLTHTAQFGSQMGLTYVLF